MGIVLAAALGWGTLAALYYGGRAAMRAKNRKAAERGEPLPWPDLDR